MDHYLDIRLRPDPEFPPAMLMGALYTKLHRVLFDLDADDIGVSFPRHKTGVRARTLGDVLRLHGNVAALDKLMSQSWLSGMRDHVTLNEITIVPEDTQYRVVRRRQFKTNAERLRRRRARRHDETIEQARAHIPDSIERPINLPFVQVGSRSTGQRFSLFIEHGKLLKEPTIGAFNRYGLSQGATVPWF